MKKFIVSLFLLMVLCFSTSVSAQVYFMGTYSNTSDCPVNVDILDGGTNVLYSFVASAGTSGSFGCQNGAAGNVRFTLGTCSLTISMPGGSISNVSSTCGTCCSPCTKPTDNYTLSSNPSTACSTWPTDDLTITITQ